MQHGAENHEVLETVSMPKLTPTTRNKLYSTVAQAQRLSQRIQRGVRVTSLLRMFSCSPRQGVSSPGYTELCLLLGV
ncbi:hypothetical protein LSTR_LSTR015246 [Laodelphax striatellus]|uniref:Uncharacterized protein n=1 Tax=Laodelphax striatellus TaxID=195883 RepID=A0A482XDD2_LAOST|nr:hypothetical protein LSTR_LSTR015246 [Laodelphax striatellus]